MISQGSSERNISVVLNQSDIARGLQAVHSAFYLSHLTLSVGIIGTGLIGSALLDQIRATKMQLREELNIDIRIRALINSTSMVLQSEIDLRHWQDLLEQSDQSAHLDEFVRWVSTESFPHAVIIDCSASENIADRYENWLQQGIHVITPNKRANSGNFEYYQKLRKYIAKGPSTNPLDRSTHYFYETTVGAGLPIISTLRDLLKTGDHVHEIEGVFSGTISYIFNSLTTSDQFSKVVRQAKNLGYTEPDPRDDLSGTDVARKLVILARELGWKISLEQVKIESLVPEQLESDLSVTEFLDQLSDYDETMQQQLQDAEKEGKVVRYVGKIDQLGNCQVGLQKYNQNHSFARLRGTENIILYRTDRYQEYPLIIKGPGAGAEVTSGGIFAEILRLADLLGSS